MNHDSPKDTWTPDMGYNSAELDDAICRVIGAARLPEGSTQTVCLRAAALLSVRSVQEIMTELLTGLPLETRLLSIYKLWVTFCQGFPKDAMDAWKWAIGNVDRFFGGEYETAGTALSHQGNKEGGG